MAKGIYPLIVGLVLVGLFAVAFINFGVGLAIDNGATTSIADDDRISTFLVLTDAELQGYNEAVNRSRSSWLANIPVVGVSLQLISSASIWKTMVSIPKTVFDLTIGLIGDVIFGGANGRFGLVFIIVGALVLAGIIMWSWSFIRSGITDPS